MFATMLLLDDSAGESELPESPMAKISSLEVDGLIPGLHCPLVSWIFIFGGISHLTDSSRCGNLASVLYCVRCTVYNNQ